MLKQNIEYEREIRQMDITNMNRMEMKDMLQETLSGIARPPALSIDNPLTSLENKYFEKYEVFGCDIADWSIEQLNSENIPDSAKPISPPLTQENYQTHIKKYEISRIGRLAYVMGTAATADAQTLKFLVTDADTVSSVDWAYAFMKRSDLSITRRTHIAQKLSTDFEDQLTKFQSFIINLRKKHHYNISQIGNADETPQTLDMPYIVQQLNKKVQNLVG
ncbi:unnamed protein product [Mytilus coruscus]|uniref:Uncharacterized protein n=1 Tax=Mytilus coruscus TaxID=42192 RepID=A0A6J8AB37_MYTCO|nr:unnamed protein product [Mytilus coruscus]